MDKTTVKLLPEYRELFNPHWRYFAFYGGRSSGKSYQVATILLLQGRQKKERILATREIQKTIKDSVHKLLSDIIEKYGFTDYQVQNDTILNTVTGTEFIFKGLRQNINEIKSTQGITKCWVEEAQSLSAHSIDVLTPTIREPGSQIIFTFNRFTELDPVFVRFVMKQPDRTFAKSVNFDALERVGLLPDVIKLEIEEDKANPELYAHKWLGEPLAQDEFSIIPRDRVLSAMNRTIEAEGSVEVGVDVARMGGDRTVFWMIHGLKTLKTEVHNKLRTNEVCAQIEKFTHGNRKITIKVDDTGVGGGVTDGMLARGYNVIPINFGSEPQNKDKYPNLISEAWFNLAETIDKIELPMNQDLLMELSTRKWKQDIKGRRVVESKQEYKKRGYRSPDCFVAGTQIKTVSGDIPIEEVQVGDIVITPFGGRKVIKTWEDRTDKITEATFSDGTVLAGKGKHRIYTWDSGWLRIDSLRKSSKIDVYGISWLIWIFHELLFTRAKNTGFKVAVDTINPAQRLTRRDFYIVGFGWTRMVKYLRGSIYTIRMAIGRIIDYLTLGLSKTTITQGFIYWKDGMILPKPPSLDLGKKKLSGKPLIGISLMKAINGTASTLSGYSRKGSKSQKCVMCVKKSLEHTGATHFHALINAGKRNSGSKTRLLIQFAIFAIKSLFTTNIKNLLFAPHLVRSRTIEKNVSVYNLTLETDNVYYANGVLVENCADAAIIAYYRGAIRDVISEGDIFFA